MNKKLTQTIEADRMQGLLGQRPRNPDLCRVPGQGVISCPEKIPSIFLYFLY